MLEENSIAALNDITTEYIRSILKPSGGFLAEVEAYARKMHVPIIHSETAALLLVLGRLKKPMRILEIGTAIGYSALVMSRFLEQGGRIDTIERNEKYADIAKVNVKKAGLENSINIIKGDAGDILKCLDRTYDMIFLDAAKGQYIELLEDCIRLLCNGGILVSDNVLYKGMVAGGKETVRRKKTLVVRLRKYLEGVCGSERLESCVIPVGDGVAVSYKLY
jgi:predicted O-methyltransferase YrrM